MAVEYAGTGQDDGIVVGRSATDLVAFHGATPTDQYAAITLATAATLGTAITSVQSILAMLREKGLIAT